MENMTDGDILLHPNAFKYICRTCLMHDDLFIIAEVSWEGVDLMDILRDWTKLEVDHDWNFPNQMCKSCIKKMYQTYAFLFRCTNSEKRIKAMISHDKFETQKRIEQLEGSWIQDDEMGEETRNEDHQFRNKFNHTLTVKEEVLSDPSEDISGVELENVEDFVLKEIDSARDEIDKIKRGLHCIRSVKKTATQKVPVIRKTYMCASCGIDFGSLKVLKRHNNDIHKKLRKYECEVCNGKSHSLQHPEGQCESDSGMKPFKCELCDVSCLENRWTQDMNIHSVKKSKRSLQSQQGSTQQALQDQHEDSELLICYICAESFTSARQLAHHENTFHLVKEPEQFTTIEESPTCEICNEALISDEMAKQHLVMHQLKKFNCKMCDEDFSSEARLKFHVKLSHSDSKLKRNFPGDEYKNQSMLKGHVGHKKHVYVCDICNKPFMWKKSFLQHQKVHSGAVHSQTIYQCNVCNQVLDNKDLLELHIQTQHRCETCEICGEYFSAKCNLLSHQKKHEKTNNYACNLCKQVFPDFQTFKKHVQSHSRKELLVSELEETTSVS